MASPPSWLNQLAEQVAGQLRAADVLAPLGCHYFLDEARKQWEVTIFVSSTETVGGRFDGRLSASKFHLDILGLLAIFTDIGNVHWQSHDLGEEDELGPHVSIEGMYEENSVWLRVLAAAPEQFPSGRLFDANEMKLVEEW